MWILSVVVLICMQEVSHIRMCRYYEVDGVCADPRKVHGRRVCLHARSDSRTTQLPSMGSFAR
jgi:hypothetical protein